MAGAKSFTVEEMEVYRVEFSDRKEVAVEERDYDLGAKGTSTGGEVDPRNFDDGTSIEAFVTHCAGVSGIEDAHLDSILRV